MKEEPEAEAEPTRPGVKDGSEAASAQEPEEEPQEPTDPKLTALKKAHENVGAAFVY
ncbi:unnamed protein product, partial [Amoebophrya sp. A25]|eukprot:GSA25T00003867001.1